MLERKVAVIGAGIHGTALGIRLTEVLNPHEFALIDRRFCMEGWFAVTERMGMSHMRSPWEHSVGGWSSLYEHYGERVTNGIKVPLQVFNNHAMAEINRAELMSSHIPGSVSMIERVNGGFKLSLAGRSCGITELYAGKVVCAVGRGKPVIPTTPGGENPLVRHSDSIDVNRHSWEDRKILVIGAGLTGATVAEAIAARGASQVVLAARSGIVVQDFDFDPSWFGGRLFTELRYMPAWERVRAVRRSMPPGSVTNKIYDRLQDWQRSRKLEIQEDTAITEFSYLQTEDRVAAWSDSDLVGVFDLIILATGYQATADDLPLSESLQRELTIDNGLPVPEDSLEVAKNLFVSGALARYGIGHAAPNIYGAKLSGDIILNNIR